MRTRPRNTDSGKQMVEDTQTAKSGARQLRLLVSAPELLYPLERAIGLMEQPEAFDGIYAQPSTGDARRIAYSHINASERAWSEFVSAPIRLIAE